MALSKRRFLLEAYNVTARGAGFSRPVRTSINLFQPFSTDGLPTAATILKSKYQFAVARWHEGKESAGFRMFPHNNDYVMGWAGQSEAPGYALLVLAKQLDDPKAAEMARRALDHLSKSPFNDNGFMVGYTPEKNQWHGQDPVSQGQAMDVFANAIRYGRQHDVRTTVWEAFLRKACDVHAARILAKDWKPRSTAEGFMVAPLCKGPRCSATKPTSRRRSRRPMSMRQRHLDMREPYWGGTLDASCEDKEGAWAGFQAFLAVYELTKEPRYLAWAEHAMDVTLSYTVVWDIDLPAGRLRDHALKTRGWTMVSAQNQHLDVYGVCSRPEIYRMGDYLKRDDLKSLAVLMFRTLRPAHRSLRQPGRTDPPDQLRPARRPRRRPRMRGGYSESWTVFWITAHFLNAAAKFAEQGVALD